MEGYEYGNAGAESVEISGRRNREGVLAAFRAGREGEEWWGAGLEGDGAW